MLPHIKGMTPMLRRRAEKRPSACLLDDLEEVRETGYRLRTGHWRFLAALRPVEKKRLSVDKAPRDWTAAIKQ